MEMGIGNHLQYNQWSPLMGRPCPPQLTNTKKQKKNKKPRTRPNRPRPGSRHRHYASPSPGEWGPTLCASESRLLDPPCARPVSPDLAVAPSSEQGHHASTSHHHTSTRSGHMFPLHRILEVVEGEQQPPPRGG